MFRRSRIRGPPVADQMARWQKLDPVELVVVAARAVHRESQEGGAGGGDHVVQLVYARHLFHNRIFVEDYAHLVPRAGDQEPGRRDLASVMRVEDVARDLVPNELVV